MAGMIAALELAEQGEPSIELTEEVREHKQQAALAGDLGDPSEAALELGPTLGSRAFERRTHVAQVRGARARRQRVGRAIGEGDHADGGRHGHCPWR